MQSRRAGRGHGIRSTFTRQLRLQSLLELFVERPVATAHHLRVAEHELEGALHLAPVQDDAHDVLPLGNYARDLLRNVRRALGMAGHEEQHAGRGRDALSQDIVPAGAGLYAFVVPYPEAPVARWARQLNTASLSLCE